MDISIGRHAVALTLSTYKWESNLSCCNISFICDAAERCPSLYGWICKAV